MEISNTLEYLRKRQTQIHQKLLGADYIICSKPDYIAFECPWCKSDVEIKVKELEEDVFDLSTIICPCCQQEVKMGDWSYD